jgi:IclR family acetate operon transcriptional repressor
VDSGTKSVRTALHVVEEVARQGAVGVSDLARQLALPKSTVQRTLATLRAAGWLRQDADSRWSLTLHCATIGRSVLAESTARAAGRPVLLDIRDRTEETTRWFLIEDTSFVLVDSAESLHAVRPVESELPGPIPLHATAVGKAAMARWTAERLDAVLERPLLAMTPRTITSITKLRADLGATRERGWGRVDEELYLDVGGVAAVTPVAGDRLVGVGVSYPLHRTSAKTIERFGRLVADAAPRLADAVSPML